MQPQLRSNVGPLTDAMVDFYMLNQKRFSADMQPHYIYSPRELSRWIRALYEAMHPLDNMQLGELVRLWGHEGLRLFHDRLVTEEERTWCEENLDAVAATHFPGGWVGCLRERCYAAFSLMIMTDCLVRLV